MTINDDIKQACEVMQRGGIILYPTDTIWGIGCDATNAEAVQRVYKIKQRADSKALIILTDSEAKVEYYVSEVPETAWQLLDVAVKPLTLIYPGARNHCNEFARRDGEHSHTHHKRTVLTTIVPTVQKSDRIDLGQYQRECGSP